MKGLFDAIRDSGFKSDNPVPEQTNEFEWIDELVRDRDTAVEHLDDIFKEFEVRYPEDPDDEYPAAALCLFLQFAKTHFKADNIREAWLKEHNDNTKALNETISKAKSTKRATAAKQRKAASWQNKAVELCKKHHVGKDDTAPDAAHIIWDQFTAHFYKPYPHKLPAKKPTVTKCVRAYIKNLNA